jgi:hypothetical protein
VIFFGHHDDDPQYRFGLLPQPLTACPRQRAKRARAVFGNCAISRTD